MKDTRETAKDYTDWMVKTGGFARDMTLRDHLAGLAMQALLRDNNMVELRDNHVIEIWRGIPDDAYLIADAMLEERAK
jgi:hypothetical protein